MKWPCLSPSSHYNIIVSDTRVLVVASSSANVDIASDNKIMNNHQSSLWSHCTILLIDHKKLVADKTSQRMQYGRE